MTLRRRHRTLSLATLLLAAACGSSRTDGASGEPEASPPPDPIATPRATPEGQGETVVEVEETTRVDDDALRAAATAAEHAPPGRDTCETAVNAIVAMLDAAESESDDHQALPRPERADFLTACRALPQPAQQCLVPTYAMGHQDDCNRILEGLPPGQLDAVQAAMETQPNE